MPWLNSLVTTAAPSTAGTALSRAPTIGQISFTAVGNVTWTVPYGVSTINAVAVGGGGAGRNITGISGYAGAAGALSYSNIISVTPGEILTVMIGSGGVGNSTSTGGADGLSSAIFRGNTAILLAAGGGHSTGGLASAGIGAIRQSGGGHGGGTLKYWGSSGAAGYSGWGGNSSPVSAGSGGGGGAAYGIGSKDRTAVAGGGGVGLRGEGSNGAAGTSGVTSGKGGSRGNNGGDAVGLTGGVGGKYGGGGGWGDTEMGNGAQGGVRIIWGTQRSYPSANCGDVFSKTNGDWTSISANPVSTPGNITFFNPSQSFRTTVARLNPTQVALNNQLSVSLYTTANTQTGESLTLSWSGSTLSNQFSPFSDFTNVTVVHLPGSSTQAD